MFKKLQKQFKGNPMNYQVTFINKDGKRVTKTVAARNEFEAVQIAGAFNLTVISAINLDL